MHPRIQELVQHLDHQRAELRRAVDSVPMELRDRPPTRSRWSIAEVLEHLALVERRVTEILTGYLDAAAAGGGIPREEETGPVVDARDMDRLLDRTRPMRASHAALPRSGMDSARAWAALEAARAELKRALLAGDGLALGAVEHPHPDAGLLNLYQWIAYVGAHEARHAAQVREIGEALRA